MSNANPNVLTRFKPGNVANPKGRPKKEWTFSQLFREATEEQDKDGIPYKVKISKKLTEMASKGDIAAIKELTNRIEGLPKQQVDLGVSFMATLEREKQEFNLLD